MKRETTAQLIDEFTGYCERHGLKPVSADELACEISEQIFQLRDTLEATKNKLARLESTNSYLQKFMERWETAQDVESVAYELSAAGYAVEVCGGGARMWHLYGPRLYAVISGLEGEEIYAPDECCTLGIYDPADGGDSLMQADYRNLRQAIAAAAVLIGEN